MTEDRKELLIGNTARNIAPCTVNIKYRHAVHCLRADKEYGKRMTKALGLDMKKVKALAQLQNDELIKATLSEDM
jgi:catalase